MTASTIDLAALAAPEIIETLDADAIVQAMRDAFVAIYPAGEATIDLESEPARKVLEVCALREVLLRARVNEAAKSLLLAHASGANLDHLGITYFNGAQRLVLVPADPSTTPPTEEVKETDADYRRRLLLQPEGESVAGPVGSYISHTLDAHTDIADASAYSPWPAGVVVSVLGRITPTPTDESLRAVAQVLGASDILSDASGAIPAATDLPGLRIDTSGALRPVGDRVIVRPATIVDYTIDADITLGTGPDTSAVANAIRANINDYLRQPRRLGRPIARSALFAALHVAGVDAVALNSPASDVVIGIDSAAHCTDSSIRLNGQTLAL